jgi:hypothetical protein
MKPYLFLHIPRTGGTTIANILPQGRSSSTKIKNLISKGAKTQTGGSLQHGILDDYNLSEGEMFTFTFVRNPWDRVVSIFEHQINSCGLKLEGPDKITKFRNFVSLLKWFWEQDMLLDELDGHLRPQSHYTHEGKRQIVDFYGYRETLVGDLSKLSSMCGMNLKLSDIPVLNQQPDRLKNYRNYYDIGNGVMKTIVHELYKKEIELYGYEF